MWTIKVKCTPEYDMGADDFIGGCGRTFIINEMDLDYNPIIDSALWQCKKCGKWHAIPKPDVPDKVKDSLFAIRRKNNNEEEIAMTKHLDKSKISNILHWIFNLATAICVFFLTTFILTFFKTNVFKGIAIVIAMLVGLDVLCFIAENGVNILQKQAVKYKAHIEEKKQRKIQDEIKKKEEEQQIKEMVSNSYYAELQEAKVQVELFRKLSESYEFKGNKKNLNSCLSKLEEILQSLNENQDGYKRVAVLFEVYLPEMYRTLCLYTDLKKAKTVDPEYKQSLAKCLEKFMNFLDAQKVDAVLDKESTEIQFKAATKTISKLLDREDET